MATPYLVITDNADTITFLNGTGTATTNSSYFIESGNWSPAVAGLRRSVFGGVGPYQDVEEEINVLIRGSSASDCYAKLDDLREMMDKAEQWSNGQNITPVYIQFSPSGSTVSSDSNPLQAIILGRAEGDETNGVTLAPEWDSVARNYVMPIRLRFVRRGLWTIETGETILGSTQNANAAQTLTFGSTHNTLSPIKLELTSMPSYSNMTLPRSILLVSSSITVVEPSTMTASGYTSVADAANLATNNVLRYTPASTAAATSGSKTQALSGMFSCFALVRSSSTSVTWTITITFRSAYSGLTTYSLPSITFVPSTTQPTVLPLGIAATIEEAGLSAGFTDFSLTITASTTSGSPTLDIDTLVFCAVDNSTRIIDIPSITYNSTNVDNPTFDHGYMSFVSPKAYIKGGSTIAPLTHQSAIDIFASGTSVQVAWLLPRGQYWRFATSGGSLTTFRPQVTRHKGYITPQ